MADNWEFALSHIEDGFVTIIGDDDCLMPESIARVAELIEEHPEISIFNHLPASYYWPDFPDKKLANRLYIRPIDFAIEVKDSKEILADVCSFKSWYGNLPVLYHGFVSAKLINKIKTKSDGIFFRFSSPDIFAAIVLAMHSDRFILIRTALTIGGQSAKSNGANYGLGTEVGKKFTAELPGRLQWRYESMSISLAVYEALENALAAFPDIARFLSVDKEKLLEQSISEVKNLDSLKKDELREKLMMIYPSEAVNQAFRNAELTSNNSSPYAKLQPESWQALSIRLLRGIKSRLRKAYRTKQIETSSEISKSYEVHECFYTDEGFIKLDQHIDVSSYGVISVDQASHLLQAELDAALLGSDQRPMIVPHHQTSARHA